MPKTPKGKHSEGAGKPAGSRSQGGFSIIGRITRKILGGGGAKGHGGNVNR